MGLFYAAPLHGVSFVMFGAVIGWWWGRCAAAITVMRMWR